MYEVSLEPGESSARCLHGRMKPLNGSAYVNLFAHYRPMLDGQGDPNWFARPNPEGTPAPLVATDEVCAVDDTQAGRFSSCGGAVATSGLDIYDFWVDNTIASPAL